MEKILYAGKIVKGLLLKKLTYIAARRKFFKTRKIV